MIKHKTVHPMVTRSRKRAADTDNISPAKRRKQEKWAISVLGFGGGFVFPDMPPLTTVLDLKTRICARNRIPVNQQRLLTTQNIILHEDAKPLHQYGIKRNDCIVLKVRGGQLFVKTLTGRTLTLDVDTFAIEVAQLKNLIAEKGDYVPDTQRLIFRGKQLEDGNRLYQYGISQEDTLHLVLRLRGGMLHESSGRSGLVEMPAPAADLMTMSVVVDDNGTIYQQTLRVDLNIFVRTLYAYYAKKLSVDIQKLQIETETLSLVTDSNKRLREYEIPLGTHVYVSRAQ